MLMLMCTCTISTTIRVAYISKDSSVVRVAHILTFRQSSSSTFVLVEAIEKLTLRRA